MRQTFWEKIDQFPPIACRLLARTKTARGGTRAMSVAEIATRAGITIMEVNSLSWHTSWAEVPFGKIRRFTEACGVNLTDRAICRLQSSYVRRGAPFKYLKQSPDWETVYKPMILAYVNSRSQ